MVLMNRQQVLEILKSHLDMVLGNRLQVSMLEQVG